MTINLKKKLIELIENKKFDEIENFIKLNQDNILKLDEKQGEYFYSELGKNQIPLLSEGIDLKVVLNSLKIMNEIFYKGIYYYIYQLKNGNQEKNEKEELLKKSFSFLINEFDKIQDYNIKMYIEEKILSSYKYNSNVFKDDCFDDLIQFLNKRNKIDKGTITYLFNKDYLKLFSYLKNNCLKNFDLQLFINSTSGNYNTSFLSDYVFFNCSNKLDENVLNMFYEFNANPNVGGYNGSSSFLQLVEHPEELLKFLTIFDNKIDYNLKYKNGHTFFIELVRTINSKFKQTQDINSSFSQYIKVIDFLLTKDIDLTVKTGSKNKGKPLLEYITKYCEPQIASLLKDRIVLTLEFKKDIQTKTNTKTNSSKKFKI